MTRMQGLLLGLLGGAVVVLGAWLTWSRDRGPGPDPGPSPREAVRVQKLLHEAHEQTKRAIQETFDPLDHLFAQAKQGTPAFAEEVLSLSGKWNYIFSSEKEYKEYLRKQFVEKVLDPDQLKKAVEQSFMIFLKECQNIDDTLFVSLRADVPDLKVAGATDAKAFSRLVEQATVEILRQSGDKIWESLVWDEAVGSMAVFIGEEVAVYVITQVASRAGLLTVSGSLSWQTLGLSIVVGLAIDWLWNWLSDPEGELASEMNKELDRLHEELRRELEKRMRQIADARHKARLRLVNQVIQGGRND